MPTRRRLRIPDLATEEELKQLEDAIAKAEAEKLNQDDYTADSWKAYANALAQAKKVLAKENATSTEVQDAIRSPRTEARKALVKVSADGKKPGAVISDTGVAVFGVAGAVVVLAAAGIALTIWRKRRI
ncbi:MAG: FIVAR domain-containing protein [Bifidobacterium bifidum]